MRRGEGQGEGGDDAKPDMDLGIVEGQRGEQGERESEMWKMRAGRLRGIMAEGR
jgi:hypothetical protein